MAKSIRTVEQKQKQIFWGIIKNSNSKQESFNILFCHFCTNIFLFNIDFTVNIYPVSDAYLMKIDLSRVEEQVPSTVADFPVFLSIQMPG